MFVPHRVGNVSGVLGFSARLPRSGARLVTDNIYLPFGGFYFRENWEVDGIRGQRSPEALLCRHFRAAGGAGGIIGALYG